jgi:hypothetical protein
MSARRLLGLLIALVIAGASGAAAQTGVRMQVQYSLNDSIVAGEPGADISIDLSANDSYGYGTECVHAEDPVRRRHGSRSFPSTTLCPDSTPR